MGSRLVAVVFVGMTVFIVFWIGVPLAHADSWAAPPPVRTVHALDKSARAVVSCQSADWWDSTACCRVSVWVASDDGPEKLLWQGKLANIPHTVFVSSQGRYLVTMDRWGGIGADPLVFYDFEGNILKRYHDPKKELLIEEEVQRVKRSVSSYWWSDGAHARFTAHGENYLLWLASGRVLVFKSAAGEQVDAKSFRRSGVGRRVVFETVDLLSSSKSPDDRIAAARFSGWLGGQAALPVLTELLGDPYYRDGPWEKIDDPWQRFGSSYMWVCPRRYPVRKAAAEEIHIHYGQAYGVIQEWIAR